MSEYPTRPTQSEGAGFGTDHVCGLPAGLPEYLLELRARSATPADRVRTQADQVGQGWLFAEQDNETQTDDHTHVGEVKGGEPAADGEHVDHGIQPNAVNKVAGKTGQHERPAKLDDEGPIGPVRQPADRASGNAEEYQGYTWLVGEQTKPKTWVQHSVSTQEPLGELIERDHRETNEELHQA